MTKWIFVGKMLLNMLSSFVIGQGATVFNFDKAQLTYHSMVCKFFVFQLRNLCLAQSCKDFPLALTDLHTLLYLELF